MEVLLILVMGIMCIICFMVGAKVGQAVAKDEKIEMPSIDPLKDFREHEAKQEAKAEQERMNVLFQNIESYNGSAEGQIDVPRG